MKNVTSFEDARKKREAAEAQAAKVEEEANVEIPRNLMSSFMMVPFIAYLSSADLTPYIGVLARLPGVVVPEYMIGKDGTITLNLSDGAISHFVQDEHGISFSARFSGRAFTLFIPWIAIAAVYPKENPQAGLQFIHMIAAPPDEEVAEPAAKSGLSLVGGVSNDTSPSGGELEPAVDPEVVFETVFDEILDNGTNMYPPCDLGTRVTAEVIDASKAMFADFVGNAEWDVPCAAAHMVRYSVAQEAKRDQQS